MLVRASPHAATTISISNHSRWANDLSATLLLSVYARRQINPHNVFVSSAMRFQNMLMSIFPLWAIRLPFFLFVIAVLGVTLGRDGVVVGFILIYIGGVACYARMAKTFAEMVLWLLAACAALGFMSPPLMQTLQPEGLTRIELPNADVKSWWVNDQHIYLASTSLGRIQKYTVDGKFIEAWQVQNFGKTYSILALENGTPIICGYSRRMQHVGVPVDITAPPTSCEHLINASMQSNPAVFSVGFAEISLANGRVVKIWNSVAWLFLWSSLPTALAFVVTFGLATALRFATN
jgi:hypothetical protein